MTATPTAADADALETIAGAAMELAGERGWARLGLAEVADRAGMPLARLYRLAPTRGDVLAAVARTADARAADRMTEPSEEDTPRDRLFEALMARFDALSPWRAGIRAVLDDLPRDPFAAAALLPRLARSMDWMLEAARVEAPPAARPALAAGLAAVWLSVLRVWLDDDSPDLAKTMAALDGRLRRAETLAGGVLRGRGGGRAA
jgi:AcrR family transcriptional regulator